MNVHHDRVYRVATMYYVHGSTMEAIAHDLRVSRSSVSRMLKEARDRGIVRISVEAPPEDSTRRLAARIEAAYGVRPHIVPVRHTAAPQRRLRDVAAAAAEVLYDAVDSGSVLGIAWGVTVSEIGRQLKTQPVRGATVVQLNGSANSYGGGITYAGEVMSAFASAFDATTHYFPVPAFFDDPRTREHMWRERSIRQVLDLQRSADVLLFGVGSLVGDPPSHVYSAGYLDSDDVAALQRARVVGDVCTVFLREDGSYRDIELNARATGPSPEEIRQVPRRICVVAGENKVAALRGALRARVATDLVIDEPAAQALVATTSGGAGARRSLEP